ncbi:hypothetical protein REPUB_Repub07fG0054600 [Reevesia pubescens]
MEILISDLRDGGRVMESQTFSVVAEMLVKLGREDEAQGHARKAEGVVYHHKDKITGVEPCIYRSLLYGWSVQENVKEARRVIKEMKSASVELDLYCYNTFLRIAPTSISYNILLSCLGRTRRVKESCRILDLMKKSGCVLDWITYYLVARTSYLTGRFGKGNMIVDEMIEQGLTPDRKFYNDLIGVLCGVERVNFALELFERMKRSSLGGYGPVYDVLIPKLCRAEDFEKGRELRDEAVATGTVHQVSKQISEKVCKVTGKC